MKSLRPGAFGVLQTRRIWLEIRKGCGRCLLSESEICDALGDVLAKFVIALSKVCVAHYRKIKEEWKLEEMCRF